MVLRVKFTELNTTDNRFSTFKVSNLRTFQTENRETYLRAASHKPILQVLVKREECVKLRISIALLCL